MNLIPFIVRILKFNDISIISINNIQINNIKLQNELLFNK